MIPVFVSCRAWLWALSAVQLGLTVRCNDMVNEGSCSMPGLSTGKRVSFRDDTASHSSESIPVTLLDVFQKDVDVTVSGMRRWTGEFIMTLLNRKRGGIHFMCHVFLNSLSLVHLKYLFKEEDFKIYNLKSRLKKIKARRDMGYDDAFRETSDVFEAYYDFMVDSLKKLHDKYSYVLAPNFEFPKFEDIACSGRVSRLSLLLRDDLYCGKMFVVDAAVDEDRLFPTYLNKFMRLIIDKYCEFSDKVKNMIGKIDSLSDTMKSLDAEIRGSHTSSDETMKKLYKRKRKIEKRIGEYSKTTDDIIEKSDHLPKYGGYFDEKFYTSLRNKFHKLLSEKNAYHMVLPHRHVRSYLLNLVFQMRENLQVFVEYIEGRGSSNFDKKTLVRKDLNFVISFKSLYAGVLHNEIVACGRDVKEVIVEAVSVNTKKSSR